MVTRSPLGGREYWDKWTKFAVQHTEAKWKSLGVPSKNPLYDPQFTFDLSKQEAEILLLRYSRGDAVEEISNNFAGLLKAWELSNTLSDDICQQYELEFCRAWRFELSDLNHYNWCFWLVGLALALDIPDDLWLRLLALIDGECEDELLDRVISSRQPDRKIGAVLLHKKPYIRLLNTIKAPHDEQAVLLRSFVDHWYPELARNGKQRLWWYDYGDPIENPLEMGSYFGRWCIEAVAVVKAFGIDDSMCLDHPCYPGDLIQDGRSPRYPDSAPATGVDMSQVKFGGATEKRRGRNWLSRLLLGPDRRR